MSIPNAKKCKHLKNICENNFSLKETEKYLQIHVGECLQRLVQSFSLIPPSFPPDSYSCMQQSR